MDVRIFKGEAYHSRISVVDRAYARRHAQIIRRTGRKVRIEERAGLFTVFVGPARARR